jgi:hypothetical protein
MGKEKGQFNGSGLNCLPFPGVSDRKARARQSAVDQDQTKE